MGRSILASVLMASIAAVDIGQVRDDVTNAVLHECHDRGIVANAAAYQTGPAGTMEKVQCRALVVDLTKYNDMSGMTKDDVLADKFKEVCTNFFPSTIQGDNHLSPECRGFFAGAYPDILALDQLDKKHDGYCNYLAAVFTQMGLPMSYDADAAAEELAYDNVTPEGSRCACSKMIDMALGSMNGDMGITDLVEFAENCDDADYMGEIGERLGKQLPVNCPGCQFFKAGLAVCRDNDVPDQQCKDFIDAAFRDQRCVIQDPLQVLREQVISPAVFSECHERGIMASASGYQSGPAGLMEKIQCRALVVDLTKFNDMSDLTKDDALANTFKAVCADQFPLEGDNHLSDDCRGFFANAYDDMRALDQLDRRTDGYCEFLEGYFKMPYDADVAAAEIAYGTVAPGSDRCNCINMMDIAMGAMQGQYGITNLVEFAENCDDREYMSQFGPADPDAEFPCPGCKFFKAGLEVCAVFGVPKAHCKAVIDAAFRNPEC